MKFWKYCAAGNDFILFDQIPKGFDQVDLSRLCDRKFGIGADGILIVNQLEGDTDFKMIYFNSDGGEVEMCGNGARSCAHWYFDKFQKKTVNFKTFSNARYQAKLIRQDYAEVTMNEFKDFNLIDVSDFYPSNQSLYMNTGVPHTIILLKQDEDIDTIHWMESAAQIRNDKRFKNGTNVNFVKILRDGAVALRTYERGVEGETLACGTGAVAVARFLKDKFSWTEIQLEVAGGVLGVRFEQSNCWLAGPVVNVFQGEIAV